MGRRVLAVVWLVAGPILGCGGGGTGGDDAGVLPPDADDEPRPEIPWLLPDGEAALPIDPPALTPCPQGYREIAEGGATTCDPYPEGGAATCPSGEAHFPGEPGCAPVGSRCPEGDFPAGLPDDGSVLFVKAGVPAGGDGSRGSPFARIADALPSASAGRTIALAPGRYVEVVALPGGVTLRGACAAMTSIAFTGTDPRPAVLQTTAGGVVVRDLTIAASDRIGINVFGAAADLTLDGVVIDGVAGLGVNVLEGAHLTARSVVVRGTEHLGKGTAGFGIGALAAGAEIERAIVEENRTAAVAADIGSVVTLTDVVLRDTEIDAISGGQGSGLDVVGGSTVEATRVLVEGNRARGIFVFDAGSRAVLTDSIVRDTRSRERPPSVGRGIGIEQGGTVEISRCLVERNREIGIFASRGSTLVADDLVVRDTASQESDGDSGRGIQVQLGSQARLTRVLIERSADAGLYVAGEGASLVLAHGIVRDSTGRASDGLFGRGLTVAVSATAEVSMTLLERNGDVGVMVIEGGQLTLTDAVVRDTRVRPPGVGGRGMTVDIAGTADVTRAVFEGNGEVGLLAYGGVARLTDVVLRRSRGDASGNGGIGAAAIVDGSVTLRRFLVTENLLAGLLLARGGVIDAEEGVISRNPIGVNVQTEPFDLSRLTRGVFYRENGRDLDMSALALPSPELPGD